MGLLAALFASLTLLLLLGACSTKKPFADLPDVGRFLVARYELPDEAVRALASKRPTAPAGAAQAAPGLRNWVGPRIALDRGGSPYTVVAILEATVVKPRAAARMTLGWRGIASDKFPNIDELSQMLPFGHYGSSGETYPLKVRKVLSSPPLSFTKDQLLALTLEADALDGFEPERITLELRAGVGGTSGLGLFAAGQWLLLGLVLLGLWWWFFKRERA
jgi:hypothetical protein